MHASYNSWRSIAPPSGIRRHAGKITFSGEAVIKTHYRTQPRKEFEDGGVASSCGFYWAKPKLHGIYSLRNLASDVAFAPTGKAIIPSRPHRSSKASLVQNSSQGHGQSRLYVHCFANCISSVAWPGLFMHSSAKMSHDGHSGDHVMIFASLQRACVLAVTTGQMHRCENPSQSGMPHTRLFIT